MHDLLFQVRHDPARVSRLHDIVRWRQIKSNAHKAEAQAAPDGDLSVLDDNNNNEDAPTAAVDYDLKSDKVEIAADLPVPPVPWSVALLYPHAQDAGILDLGLDDDDDDDSDDTPKIVNPRLARLAENDRRTATMSRAEYARWFDARKASFQHRRRAAFRAWCGLDGTASGTGDDIPGVLDILLIEWVQTLTTEARRERDRERDRERHLADTAAAGPGARDDTKQNPPRLLVLDDPEAYEQEAADVIRPRHVHLAYARLQTPPRRARAMLNGTRLPMRKTLKLVSQVLYT